MRTGFRSECAHCAYPDGNSSVTTGRRYCGVVRGQEARSLLLKSDDHCNNLGLYDSLVLTAGH